MGPKSLTLKKLVLLITLLFVGGGETYRSWPLEVHVGKQTLSMPRKDVERLRFFFREVCFLECWAYTLAGVKPISLIRFKKAPSLRIHEAIDFCRPPDFWKKTYYFFYPHHYRISLGWRTLQKYLGEVAHPRYRVVERSAGESIELSLVDMEGFRKAWELYQDDVEKALGRLVGWEELLKDLEQTPFPHALLDHEALRGIFLGFGRENSWAYEQGRGGLISPWGSPLDKGFEKENFDRLNRKTLDCASWEIEDLFYPRFAALPDSQETEELCQRYREARGKIVEYYRGGDCVEATLLLFQSSLSLNDA